ncbi:MAG TPA: alpha-L-rhamnosidase C-terminal domain-containing protein [bacterium]|nr:alpha-L-rhamnosidase C-terminal domain-containing protein [bacterium]HPN42098.1 alpha-L-rhamnosidase C-terminal domain-containing protein [bacterium]
MKKVILLLLGLLTGMGLAGDAVKPAINPVLLQWRWQANWIAPSNVSLYEYGIYHFRRTFDLQEKPQSFIIHVSADNRYRLFVNGAPVSVGPARGDLPHWRFETVDIAPQLKAGKNVLAAQVWNFAEYAPVAQMTYKTAFILQGDTEREAVVNTNKSWKVLVNCAYSPTWKERSEPGQYQVVGPGDRVDGALYPWGWTDADYNDDTWGAPIGLGNGTPRGFHDAGMKWLLVPRSIPPMEEKKQRIPVIRRSEGLTANDGFLKGEKDLVVPANTSGVFLLDQSFLTIGYPELLVSKGQGSKLTILYAEALFDKNNNKANRNDIDNRKIYGFYDVFVPDGGENRLFRPLWLRTWRYMQVEIETAAEPLVIHDLYGIFTAYPFIEKAAFTGNDPSLEKIWETGWRTARLCAGENYFDCPYYEQLQYVGDTRIQALISLYVTGDDRLMRNAIRHFDDSRIPDGLTASRYPSETPQIIPPFSLFWVAMIHDYWMHRPDTEFVGEFLMGIQGVLDWYEKHIDNTGMLGPMPFWNFVDWPDQWAWDTEKGIGGIPAGAEDGNSSILTLQFAYTLNLAAELFDAYQKPAVAVHYRQLSASVIAATRNLCRDENRAIYADTPEKKEFSQHANIMVVLSGSESGEPAKKLLQNIMQDKSLIPCTLYYRFYMIRAMKKAGLADLYVDQLQYWRDMINIGLTTFAERPEPSRSDCHAWSASPNYDLLATVCGIMPDTPGFKTVLIEPHLGSLQWIKGAMPHPQGMINVDLQRKSNNGITGQVTLPAGVQGRFVWNGKEIPLKAGNQDISL